MSHKLEKLQFKLEKILGFRNMQEKLENENSYESSEIRSGQDKNFTGLHMRLPVA